MLRETFSLHDVRDVEALAVWVIDRSGLDLSWHEREDLLTFLIEQAWFLSRRFKPGGTISFSTYATSQLRLHVTEWKRLRYGRSRWTNGAGGRTYQRLRLPPVPLSELEDERRLGRPLAGRTMDAPEGGTPDVLRVLRAGGGRQPLLADLEGARRLATVS